jgi:leucyl/phenylalanyl-tRNA--protein transferase
MYPELGRCRIPQNHLFRSMVISRFPDVELADEHGLLAVGGDLEVESLLLAYSSGIFPWPISRRSLTWFAPPQRAVLFLENLHISRSMRRLLNRSPFELRMDSNFNAVIERCAELTNRGEQGGTWITPMILRGYKDFFAAGHCHSFEAYLDNSLVGGLYGVQIGKFFVAESSFYRVSGASKVAFCFMCEYLQQCGITWFDCQMLTPFSEGFGAREIPRAEFMHLLQETLSADGDPTAP